jgi:hypothetical protein
MGKKENVIKFSASIAQKFRVDDDVSDRLELGYNSSLKNGNAAPSSAKDEEESQRRKEERRKKAALFLQKLKAQQAMTNKGEFSSNTT